jgi:hypothetical protein
MRVLRPLAFHAIPETLRSRMSVIAPRVSLSSRFLPILTSLSLPPLPSLWRTPCPEALSQTREHAESIRFADRIVKRSF